MVSQGFIFECDGGFMVCVGYWRMARGGSGVVIFGIFFEKGCEFGGFGSLFSLYGGGYVVAWRLFIGVGCVGGEWEGSMFLFRTKGIIHRLLIKECMQSVQKNVLWYHYWHGIGVIVE